MGFLKRTHMHYVQAFAGIVLIAGCKSPPAGQIELMPAPDVYGDGLLNPLPKNNPFDAIPYDGILFATDRAPAGEEDKEAHYLSETGYLLRLGLAEIQFGEKEYPWEKAREISLLKSRTERFPVKIAHVEEWGMMEEALPFWIDLEQLPPEERPPNASGVFSDALNLQLANSERKDIYIYIHGYKVTYENPVLVSAELWHFLGYQGAFIAYSWPSTPSKYAYIRDTDTSVGFARNLRLLLEFAADHTEAENIHIIGYSNGTRLVIRALEQLALKYGHLSPEEMSRRLRIRTVALLGSDLDRNAFGAYVSDGVLDVADHVTVYVSAHDRALGFSRFLTRRARLGEMWSEKRGEMHPVGRKAIADLKDRLSFVNVSEAEGATTGKGHGYFRSSPWASSDLLMSLYYGLGPVERGLEMQQDMPVYTFPPDYISRLWRAIEKKDPVFAENVRRLNPSESDN
jgi:esterase/lipase superfamily enzyme